MYIYASAVFFFFFVATATPTPYWQIWNAFVGQVELSSKTRWCNAMPCWLSVKLSAVLSRPQHADAHIQKHRTTFIVLQVAGHIATVQQFHYGTQLCLWVFHFYALIRHCSTLHSSGQRVERVRVELRRSEFFYRINKCKHLSKWWHRVQLCSIAFALLLVERNFVCDHMREP